MRETFSFKRVISLIVVICFLTTNAMAMPSQSLLLGTRDSGLDPFLANLSIPFGLGSVVETYDASKSGTRDNEGQNIRGEFRGASPRSVIYIQDAHDSLEAQENIAAMVQYFVKEYGVNTVYEEGYEGPVPTDKLFENITDPVLKEKISYYLMDKLRVGGAEYAHINRLAVRDSRLAPRDAKPKNKQPLKGSDRRVPSPESRTDFELVGADSINLHLENIRAYEQAAKNRGGVSQDIGRIRKDLQKMIDKNFPKEMKSWLKLKERYQNGQLPLLNYLERIYSTRGTANGERGTKTLNVNRLPFPGVEALLAGDEKKIKQIGVMQLLGEIKSLENEMVEQGLPAERDRKTYGYYQSVLLLEKLNTIELSHEEFTALKESLEGLKTEDVAQFIARETNHSIVLFRSWESLITDAISFYELAKKRDAVLGKFLAEFSEMGLGTRDSSLVKTSPESRGPSLAPAVLVFGGFHKEAIRRMMKEKGISYVILSPAIGAPSKRHEDYYRFLMEGGKYAFEKEQGLGTGDSHLAKNSDELKTTSPEARVKGIARQNTCPERAPGMPGYKNIINDLAGRATPFLSEKHENFILAMDDKLTPYQQILASEVNVGALASETRSEVRRKAEEWKKTDFPPAKEIKAHVKQQKAMGKKTEPVYHPTIRGIVTKIDLDTFLNLAIHQIAIAPRIGKDGALRWFAESHPGLRSEVRGFSSEIENELQFTFGPEHPEEFLRLSAIQWASKEAVFFGNPQEPISMKILFDRARETIKKLDFKPEQKVLDIGTGPRGGFSFIAALQGAHVTAVERDAVIAAQLRARYQNLEAAIQKAGGRWNLIQADFISHDFGGEQFDTILMTDVLTVNPLNAAINVKAPLTVLNQGNAPLILKKVATLKKPGGGKFLYSVPDILDNGQRYLRVIPMAQELGAALAVFAAVKPNLDFVSTPFSGGTKRGVLMTLELMTEKEKQAFRAMTGRRSEMRDLKPLEDLTWSDEDFPHFTEYLKGVPALIGTLYRMRHFTDKAQLPDWKKSKTPFEYFVNVVFLILLCGQNWRADRAWEHFFKLIQKKEGTAWFYHPQAIQAVADEAGSILSGDKSQPVVIYNYGSAGGEESYSLALLLKHRYPGPAQRVKIIAADKVPQAISELQLLNIRDVPEELKDAIPQYFDEVLTFPHLDWNNKPQLERIYALKKEFMHLVELRTVDVLGYRPEQGTTNIIMANGFLGGHIGKNSGLEDVLRKFHKQLRPGGVLVVSNEGFNDPAHKEAFMQGIRNLMSEGLFESVQESKNDLGIFRKKVRSEIRDQSNEFLATIKAEPGQERFKVGVAKMDIFNGEIRTVPFESTRRMYGTAKDPRVLALFVPDAEKERLLASGVLEGQFTDIHVPGSLAFVRCYVRGKQLVVAEVQSDVYPFLKKDETTRVRYKDWRKVMRLVTEAYARNFPEIEEIVSPSSETILRRWPERAFPGIIARLQNYGDSPFLTKFLRGVQKFLTFLMRPMIPTLFSWMGESPFAERMKKRLFMKALDPELARIVYDQNMPDFGYVLEDLHGEISWEGDLSLKRAWVKKLRPIEQDPLMAGFFERLNVRSELRRVRPASGEPQLSRKEREQLTDLGMDQYAFFYQSNDSQYDAIPYTLEVPLWEWRVGDVFVVEEGQETENYVLLDQTDFGVVTFTPSSDFGEHQRKDVRDWRMDFGRDLDRGAKITVRRYYDAGKVPEVLRLANAGQLKPDTMGDYFGRVIVSALIVAGLPALGLHFLGLLRPWMLITLSGILAFDLLIGPILFRFKTDSFIFGLNQALPFRNPPPGKKLSKMEVLRMRSPAPAAEEDLPGSGRSARSELREKGLTEEDYQKEKTWARKAAEELRKETGTAILQTARNLRFSPVRKSDAEAEVNGLQAYLRERAVKAERYWEREFSSRFSEERHFPRMRGALESGKKAVQTETVLSDGAKARVIVVPVTDPLSPNDYDFYFLKVRERKSPEKLVAYGIQSYQEGNTAPFFGFDLLPEFREGGRNFSASELLRVYWAAVAHRTAISKGTPSKEFGISREQIFSKLAGSDPAATLAMYLGLGLGVSAGVLISKPDVWNNEQSVRSGSAEAAGYLNWLVYKNLKGGPFRKNRNLLSAFAAPLVSVPTFTLSLPGAFAAQSKSRSEVRAGLFSRFARIMLLDRKESQEQRLEQLYSLQADVNDGDFFREYLTDALKHKDALGDVMGFVDKVFSKAKAFPKNSRTRIVFLKAGAEPLYRLAKIRAMVTGEFPPERIHSVWITMKQNEVMSKDPQRAVDLVKYLKQEGVLADADHLLFVDTDATLSHGSHQVIAQTLLDHSVMERADPELPVWNAQGGDHRLEFLYMSAEAMDSKNYKGIPLSSYAPEDPNSFSAVDVLPKLVSVEPRFADEGGIIQLRYADAYGKRFGGEPQKNGISHYLEHARLVLELMATLEKKGWEVAPTWDLYVHWVSGKLAAVDSWDDNYWRQGDKIDRFDFQSAGSEASPNRSETRLQGEKETLSEAQRVSIAKGLLEVVERKLNGLIPMAGEAPQEVAAEAQFQKDNLHRIVVEKYRLGNHPEISAKYNELVTLCEKLTEATEEKQGSELRLKVPEAAVAVSDPILGKVANVKILGLEGQQLRQVASFLSRMEEKFFNPGNRGSREGSRSSDQWERTLTKFPTWILVDPQGEVAGVIYGSLSLDRESAELLRVLTRQDGVRGRGSLLMDVFLSQMFQEGAQEVFWRSFNSKSHDFYDSYLEKREATGAVRIENHFRDDYRISLLKDILAKARDKASVPRKIWTLQEVVESLPLSAQELLEQVRVKDPEILEHMKRVMHLSLITAEELGMSSSLPLAQAALLHDIGKLAIPDEILNNSNPELSEAEWLMMKTHAQKGADLLASIPGLEVVREIVLSHHERTDGKGYPRGLKGEEISLEAKIIAVADSFDAMTAGRVYQEGIVAYRAVREFLNHANAGLLDLIVVKAFARAWHLENEKRKERGETFHPETRSEVRASDFDNEGSISRMRQLLEKTSSEAKSTLQEVLESKVRFWRNRFLQAMTGSEGKDLRVNTMRMIQWFGGIGLAGESAAAWFDHKEVYSRTKSENSVSKDLKDEETVRSELRVIDRDVQGKWMLPGVTVQQERFDRVVLMPEEYHPVLHVNINGTGYSIGHGDYLVLTLPSGKKLYWGGQHNLSYAFFFKWFGEEAKNRLGSILWRHADQHQDLNIGSLHSNDPPQNSNMQSQIDFGLQTLNASNYLGFIRSRKLARVEHAAAVEELDTWNQNSETGGVLDIDLDILVHPRTAMLQDSKVFSEKLAKAATTAEVIFITNSSELQTIYPQGQARPGYPKYLDPDEAVAFGIRLIQAITKQDALRSEVREKGTLSATEADNPYVRFDNVLNGFMAEDLQFDGLISSTIDRYLMAHIRPKVLILGAGGGEVVREFRENYGDSTDLSFINRERIRIPASQYLSCVASAGPVSGVRAFLKYFHRNVTIHDVEDGLKMYKRGSFQVVLLTRQTWRYIQKRAELLQEIQRVLVQGGKAFISQLDYTEFRILDGTTAKTLSSGEFLKLLSDQYGDEYELFNGTGTKPALVITKLQTQSPFSFLRAVDSKPFRALTSSEGKSGKKVAVPVSYQVTYDVDWKSVRKKMQHTARSEVRGEKENRDQEKWTKFLEVYANSLPGFAGVSLNKFWEEIFEKTPAGSRILDLATGNGAVAGLAPGIPGKGFDVWAIDYATPKVIAPGVNFRQASMETFSGIKDIANDFDLVTGQFAIEYGETESVLKQIHKVLKDGGKGVFVIHHKNSFWVDRARSLMAQITWAMHTGVFEVAQRYVQDPSGENLKSLQDVLEVLQSEINRRKGSKTDHEVLSYILRYAFWVFEEVRGGRVSGLADRIEDAKMQWNNTLWVKEHMVNTAFDEGAMDGFKKALKASGFDVLKVEPWKVRGQLRMKEQDMIVAWRVEIQKPVAPIAEAQNVVIPVMVIRERTTLADITKYLDEMAGRVFHAGPDAALAPAVQMSWKQRLLTLRQKLELVRDGRLMGHPACLGCVNGGICPLVAGLLRGDKTPKEDANCSKAKRPSLTNEEVTQALQQVQTQLDHPALRSEVRITEGQLFSPQEVRIIDAKRQLLKRIYPFLNQEQKQAILHPHILPVLLGVKSAYVSFETSQDRDREPGTQIVSEAIGKFPQLWQSLGLIFTNNYIVSLEHLMERFQKEGQILVETGVLTPAQLSRFSKGPVDQAFIRDLTGWLVRYIPSIPGREIVQGFVIGYPLEDIRFQHEIGRASCRERV